MVKEPCKLLIDKIKEHGTITKCPYCKEMFDIHTGMIFLEGKETGDPRKWNHDYFEDIMKPDSNQTEKTTKAKVAGTVMTNEKIRKFIGQRAEEVKDKALRSGWKFGGEKECDNCDYENAWILTSKDGFNEVLCSNCGYDTLGLDWSNISKPLPWPPE